MNDPLCSFPNAGSRPSADRAVSVSVYDYYLQCTETYADRTALSFYNVTFTYCQLNEKILQAASALAAFGIQKGDTVVVALPSIPEALFLMYAVNRIGAVFAGVDCRLKAADVLQITGKLRPKICFIADFQTKAFTGVGDIPVVYVRATNSIGGIANVFGGVADLFTGRLFTRRRNRNIITYKDFINASTPEAPKASVSGGDICAYFHTSGTTYGRKCVVLTNGNINASSYQYSLVYKEMCGSVVGDKFLGIMPPFTCYGYTHGLHSPLAMGVQVCLVPLLQKDVSRDLLRERPNHIISVPSHWEGFAAGRRKDPDLSFLKTVAVGGDRIDPAYGTKVNEIFRRCGSSAELMAGYGLTETASSATSPSRGKPFGFVGRPLAWTQIKIVDPDTGRELPQGEAGEICICGPSVCQGYLDDRAATDALLRVHEDGRVWLHSGDIGRFDSDGDLFYCERRKRMFVRYDGTKVSPFEIEQQLLTCVAVKQCMVTPVTDKDHSHGKLPKAYIVPQDGMTDRRALAAVQSFMRHSMADHMRPVETDMVKNCHIQNTVRSIISENNRSWTWAV